MLATWIAATAFVFVVVVRPWSSPGARNPAPWADGVAVTGLGLWRGALAYLDAIADGAQPDATQRL